MKTLKWVSSSYNPCDTGIVVFAEESKLEASGG